MQIIWTESARVDLLEIKKYIDEIDLEMARATIRKIYQTAESLVLFPNRGRPSEKENVREMVVSSLPFILVYTVEQETVQILRVFHTAQDR